MTLIVGYIRTLENGVGGHINGGYLSSTGIQWAKDTIYILYSSIHQDKPETTHIIKKFNRENAVFIKSDNVQRLFFSALSTASTKEVKDRLNEELNDKWGEELKNLADSGTADYYILLSYETGIAFLINNSSNSTCKVSVENGVFKFSKDLVKINSQYHKERENYKGSFVILSTFPLIAEK